MEYPLLIILAFTMASKESDFQDFIKNRDETFVEWQNRNPGDFKAYLDSKILEFSKPKDIKILKKQVYFLALYKAKKEPPSQILLDYSKKYENILNDVDIEKITWKDLLSKVQSINFEVNSLDKK
jgi:hypothetical protein